MAKSTADNVVDKYKDQIEKGAGQVSISDLQSGLIKLLKVRAGNPNQDVVDEYADQMSGGKGRRIMPAAFPPIHIWQVADVLYLTAGSHRWRAAKKAGKETIAAKFSTGKYADALKDAVASNAEHGVRPTRADVRYSLLLLLERSEFKNLSDNALARLVGCSPTTVGTVRKESETADDDKIRVGADGRKQNTARIGKKAKSPKAPLSNLDSDDDDEPPLCRCDNGPVVDGERCQSCIDHDRGECVHCQRWASRDASGACIACGDIHFESEPEADGAESVEPASETEARMRAWNATLEKMARGADELGKLIASFKESSDWDVLSRPVKDRLFLMPESLRKTTDALRAEKGYKDCPKCSGAGTNCDFCLGRGFVNMVTFKSLEGE